MSADEIDLDSRQLCPDGACIGVIGPDGRCKVCGLEGEPGGPYRALASNENETEAVTEAQADDADAAIEAEADDDRELCPDEACIGLIGEDGRCKVCGTPARS